MRGHKDLLNDIHRRKPSAGERARGSSGGAGSSSHDHAALEVGAYGGLAAEVDALKRDKQLLVQEVIRLRQAQQSADEEIRTLSDRLDLTEQRQQQMVTFFAQALQHPALVQHFVSSSPSIKRLEDGRRRKKRRGATGGVTSQLNATTTTTTTTIGAGSDSDTSDIVEAGHDALIVAPTTNSAQQSLADLAQAFMQLLNTQNEPTSSKRNNNNNNNNNGNITIPGVQRQRATPSGPIIEEESPGNYSTVIPGMREIDGFYGAPLPNGGPMVMACRPLPNADGISGGGGVDGNYPTATADGCGGPYMSNQYPNYYQQQAGAPFGGQMEQLPGLEGGGGDALLNSLGGGGGGGGVSTVGGGSRNAIVELPELSSFNLDDLSDLDALDQLPDMLASMPSEDLLITDSNMGRMNEAWNSQVHPPAGQTSLAANPAYQQQQDQQQL